MLRRIPLLSFNLPATLSHHLGYVGASYPAATQRYSNVGFGVRRRCSFNIFAMLCLFCYRRSSLHHFLSYFTKSVASFSTKARLSRVHPPKSHTEGGCIKTTIFCESLFDLTKIVCCHETRNVHGMFRNSHDII